MRAEVSGALRRAMRGEIGRAPAHHAADRADPGRDKAAVGQLPNPDGEIDMVFQEIDHAVSQHKANVDVLIGLEELRHHGEDMQTAEDNRRGNDQVAFRRRGALGFPPLPRGFACTPRRRLVRRRSG